MLNQGNAKHVAEIRRFVVHEYYNARNFDYDIALVQLKKAWPSSLEQYIQPICLPAPSQTFTEGHRCWVTGWGYRSEQGKELKNIDKWCNSKVWGQLDFLMFWKEVSHAYQGCIYLIKSTVILWNIITFRKTVFYFNIF